LLQPARTGAGSTLEPLGACSPGFLELQVGGIARGSSPKNQPLRSSRS